MLNKTMIIGHVGREPEMRYLADGQPVTSFSVACSRHWKAKDGTDRDETTWFKVTCWGKLAETMNEYLRKGTLVYVEGAIKASAWINKDGAAQASLDLTAQEVRFLSKKENGEAPAPAPATAQPKPATVEEVF